MRIQHRMVGDVAILDLNGELKLGDEGLLRDEVNRLIQQGQKRLVLNLTDVPYMNSTGLSAIVGTYTTTRKRGGDLKLLHPAKRVRDLLIISGLSTVLGVFDSEEDAVRSFSMASISPDTDGSP